MFAQLPLSIALDTSTTFDNFYIADANQVTVNTAKAFCQQLDEHFLYIWGQSGSGVTHLLQAIQHQNSTVKTQYLPLGDLASYPAESIVDGLEQMDLIVIDDLQKVIGIESWELALFHLYNRLRDNGKRLIVGANMPPRQLNVILPDLHSRLQWGIVCQLQSLQDEEKSQLLQMRASTLGLQLNEEVVQFILNRSSRNIHQLIDILDKMDRASLAEQRRLTIPFVKQVLDL